MRQTLCDMVRRRRWRGSIWKVRFATRGSDGARDLQRTSAAGLRYCALELAELLQASGSELGYIESRESGRRVQSCAR